MPSPGRNVPTVRVIAGKPTEFEYTLSAKSVPHGTVVFWVTNGGTRPHSFSINGRKTPSIAPGARAKLTVLLPTPGVYPYFCGLAGHAAAGMKGALRVT